MFSREHFRAVRRSLKTDGIFCQWLPLFQLTRPQYDVIVRTFREVFPEAYLIRGDFYTELPIVGLVGGRALSAQPWELTAQACARLRLAGDVTDALVRHAEGVAMMIVGPLPDPGPGLANTLGNAWLEWRELSALGRGARLPVRYPAIRMTDISGAGPGEPASDREPRTTCEQDGIRYELRLDQAGLKAGKASSIKLRVSTPDGAPFNQLEPFMEAYAHLVGFGENFKTILHTHP